eukprot:8187730-Pyramimonas_sp.AAC.1
MRANLNPCCPSHPVAPATSYTPRSTCFPCCCPRPSPPEDDPPNSLQLFLPLVQTTSFEPTVYIYLILPHTARAVHSSTY